MEAPGLGDRRLVFGQVHHLRGQILAEVVLVEPRGRLRREARSKRLRGLDRTVFRPEVLAQRDRLLVPCPPGLIMGPPGLETLAVGRPGLALGDHRLTRWEVGGGLLGDITPREVFHP